MPLSKLQRQILRTLASQRNPGSYVAGSTPLNLSAARYSRDIDIFHDSEDVLAQAAAADAAILSENGFVVEWTRRFAAIHSASVSRAGERTKLEWVADSDYRFFPVIPDQTFGYVLHPVDLATNKVAATFGRREPRDVVDLIAVHDRILAAGAAIWATADKAPGFTPEGIIHEIRRSARYTAAEFAEIQSDPPVDPGAVTVRLREILTEAEEFVLQMPTEQVGLIYLSNGRAVQPDPLHLDRYQTHAACRQGHWPTSIEISAAMVDYYRQNLPTDFETSQ